MLCSVAASVGGIEMTGISHGPEPTILVTSKVGGPVEATPLVEFKLEVNPLERPEMDMTVKAALKPIQITYDFVSGSGVNQLVLRAARMDVCLSCCVQHCLWRNLCTYVCSDILFIIVACLLEGSTLIFPYFESLCL